MIAMDINIRHLRVFMQVCETGSLKPGGRRAAHFTTRRLGGARGIERRFGRETPVALCCRQSADGGRRGSLDADTPHGEPDRHWRWPSSSA